MLIVFGNEEPADAKDNEFLPGANAWLNKLFIPRSLERNYGLFDSKTTSSSSSGEPRKILIRILRSILTQTKTDTNPQI